MAPSEAVGSADEDDSRPSTRSVRFDDSRPSTRSVRFVIALFGPRRAAVMSAERPRSARVTLSLLVVIASDSAARSVVAWPRMSSRLSDTPSAPAWSSAVAAAISDSRCE